MRPRVTVPLPLGVTILGRFRIASVLGDGGMATVYAAEEIRTRQQVALKVLGGRWADTPEAHQRFALEANTHQAIEHPGVVKVYGVESLPDGRPVIVMERLWGETLADLIDRRGAVGVERACEVVRGVADALEAAHGAGVIHRDLKSENVFLAETDRGVVAKILDFGVAHRSRGERLTKPGCAVGTPAYMAPEQAISTAVAPALDIYALGTTLFECLTGRLPFDDLDLRPLMRRKLLGAPSVAAFRPALPPALVELVDACLSPEPGDRPQSAAAVREGLDRVLRAFLKQRRTLGDATPTRRRRGVAAFVVAAIGSAAAGLALLAAAQPTVQPLTFESGVDGRAAPGPEYAVIPHVRLERVKPPAVTEASIAPAAPMRPRPTPALPIPQPEEPMAAVAAPPPPDPRCERRRKRARDARSAQAWSDLLRLSRSEACWLRHQAERRQLRVLALAELGRSHACVEEGRGITDPVVTRLVKLCIGRLDRAH